MPVKKNSHLPRGIYQIDAKGKMFGIQYTDIRGRRRREKAGTLKMAEDLLLQRHLDKLRRKMPGTTSRYGVKFSELIDDAINYAFSQNDPTAAHDLRLKLERIRTTFGDKPADSITRQQIIDWLEAEMALRKWKPSSRNRYQSAWSLVYRLGIENKKAAENPVKGIKQKQEDNGRIRFLSMEEEKALGETITDPLQHAAMILAIHTGMRKSEQERSEVGDYDQNTKMFMVRQKKNRRGPAVRYVPMTPIAVNAYSLLSVDKKAGDKLCQEQLEDTRWFDKAVDEAKVEDYTWHCHRHTYCSRLVMGGVPLAAVARYAGHSNVQMTMRYSHLVPQVNDEAVAKMMKFYDDAA